MKKLLKNILLTTTAVAGIIVPSTIVAKQSNNYVEATETSTLTPFIMGMEMYGSYYNSDPNATITSDHFVAPTATLYFDVEQLYDLGLVSINLSETKDLDIWVASAFELKNNIHISGSYEMVISSGIGDPDQTVTGTIDEVHVPTAPFLTEDYDLEVNSNNEVEYSLNDRTEYLALTLWPTYEAFTAGVYGEPMSLEVMNITIDEFYYTTIDDQVNQNPITISNLYRPDDSSCRVVNEQFYFHDENSELSSTEEVHYYVNDYSYDIEKGDVEFNITSNGITTPYMDLTVGEFSNAGEGTPWYVWAILSVGVIAVIGLIWWAIHALRNRRSNKKEETKA